MNNVLKQDYFINLELSHSVVRETLLTNVDTAEQL